LGYNFLIVKQYLQLFKEAFLNTLNISVISIIFALIFGVIGGLSRVSKNKFISSAAAVYVNLIRSTPLLTQLYLIYFGYLI
jgi:polar amino acid transport system permease protein